MEGITLNFDRIPVVLKRYDFASKMNICQWHSRKVMSTNGLVHPEKLIGNPLPWELETFALFSVSTLNEYSNNTFEGRKGMRQFIEIINSIKNYVHPKLHLAEKQNTFADDFMIVTGLNQLPIQEYIYYKTYRYSYIFDFKNENVDMETEFFTKFGCTYKEFKDFGVIINFFFANDHMTEDIFKYLIHKYRHVVRQLQIQRSDFKSIQEKVTKDITQYLYGFKYFFQFPFIVYNETTYLPLPHLVVPSVTSSLLFRLTQGNDTLRGLLGKEVLESYIEHICNIAGDFDEVVTELVYTHKNNQKRTLDVMIRKGNQCFMLDSKSMAPKLSLRDLVGRDIERTIDILADNVVQVYKHITERFKSEYDPFDKKIDFLKENIFGAVIFLEDSFIRRESIMKKAATILNMDLASDNYKYLCSNVKLLSLYELERIMFQRIDVFHLLTERRRERTKWFDYSLINSFENHKETIKEVSQTIEDTIEIVLDFAEEIKREKVII